MLLLDATKFNVEISRLILLLQLLLFQPLVFLHYEELILLSIH